MRLRMRIVSLTAVAAAVAGGAAAAVGGGRGIYPRGRLRSRPGYLHRTDERDRSHDGPDPYPFHLAGRAALSHRDRDLLHAVRPAHPRPGGDAVPRLAVDRGPPVLPPAEGARAPPVLVGQHRRPDRLLSGRRRD